MNHKRNFENAVNAAITALRNELKKDYSNYFRDSLVCDPCLSTMLTHIRLAEADPNDLNLSIVMQYADAFLNRKNLFSDTEK